MILIVVLGIGGIFTLINLSNLNSDSRVLNKIFNYYDKTQARNLAASGIDIATKELSLNKDWSGSEISLNIGSLLISVSSTNSQFPNGPNMSLTDHYEIESIGIVDEMEDTIKCVVQVTGVTSGPPEFFNYSMLCGNTASINGNLHITDDGNSSWNSNFHTNGNIQLNGTNSIDGFGSYSGSVVSNPPENMDLTFKPNNNPSGGVTHYQAPTVDIPLFNASDYQSKATNSATGNLIISGNQTLGTEANPVIYYVEGDLILKANMTGYGIFIVTGNVICQENVTISSPSGAQNNLAIYANGDINLHDNVSVSAQLLSKSNINFGNNSQLHGLATAKGYFNFNGTVNVFYKPSGTALTEPFWESEGGSGRAQLISYYE
ncbi:MAG: hypothetical protein IPH62_10655 [Ignavibacteriae bacterium]|nr:hypothetical protein [Ignavibacteriota bacterium]